IAHLWLSSRGEETHVVQQQKKTPSPAPLDMERELAQVLPIAPMVFVERTSTHATTSTRGVDRLDERTPTTPGDMQRARQAADWIALCARHGRRPDRRHSLRGGDLVMYRSSG